MLYFNIVEIEILTVCCYFIETLCSLKFYWSRNLGMSTIIWQGFNCGISCAFNKPSLKSDRRYNTVRLVQVYWKLVTTTPLECMAQSLVANGSTCLASQVVRLAIPELLTV